MRATIFLAAALAALPAGAAYKCVDEKGVTHIGDQPPAACAKVIMYEVNRSGTVLRKIDPSLTGEEAVRKEEEDARRKEAEKAVSEQKRKDIALLSTYATEKEFDIARDRNVEPIQARIKQAEERSKAIDVRIKKIEEEMEFYKAGKGKSGKASKDAKKDIPPQLTTDMEQAKNEKVTIAKGIVNSEKEIVEIKAKFETDRKRWVELQPKKSAPKKQ